MTTTDDIQVARKPKKRDINIRVHEDDDGVWLQASRRLLNDDFDRGYDLICKHLGCNQAKQTGDSIHWTYWEALTDG